MPRPVNVTVLNALKAMIHVSGDTRLPIRPAHSFLRRWSVCVEARLKDQRGL